jgi:hypothetical protein
MTVRTKLNPGFGESIHLWTISWVNAYTKGEVSLLCTSNSPVKVYYFVPDNVTL